MSTAALHRVPGPSRPRRWSGFRRPRPRGARTTAVALLVGVLAGLGVVVAAPPPAALAGPGTVDWARQIGGSGVVDTVSSVDTAGTSTFVAGRFTNSITLDGTTITAPNNADGYVAELAADGTADWLVKIGSGTGNDAATHVAADSSGNVYVAGSFSGTVSFGATTLTTPTSAGFLAKLDGSGAFQWAVKLESATVPPAIAGLDVGADGRPVIGGAFQGTMAAGGSSLTSLGGATDVFLARYESNGGGSWGARFGSASSTDVLDDLAVDEANTVVVAGRHSAGSSFGPFALPYPAATSFVSRIAPGGAPLWVTLGHEVTATSVTAQAGMVGVTGGFYGTGSLATSSVTSNGSDQDAFVALLAASTGAVSHLRAIGSTGADRGDGIAFDEAGNVYVALDYRGTLAFGGVAYGTANGSRDVLTALLSPTGAELWATRAWGIGTDVPTDLAVAADGGPVVVGTAAQTLSYDAGSLSFANQQGIALRYGDPLPETASSRYHPGVGFRALDSRTGTGGYASPWGPGTTRTLTVAGVHGVPAGAKAVVVNLTAVTPTAATHLTVYPTGSAAPTHSNLNAAAGEVVANLATVPVGMGGNISIFNNSGSTHVLADLVGWYLDDPTESRFTGLTPVRVLDSRDGTATPAAPFGPAQSRTVQIAGLHGIPADATAVVLNLTATQPTAGTHVTVWPHQYPMPGGSMLNVAAGQTRPNQVIVGLNQGKIDLRNNAGSVHLLADAVGYFTDDAGAGELRAVTPARIGDTRTGLGGRLGQLGPGQSFDLPVEQVGGVPPSATSVVLNVTVTGPTAPSHLTVWNTGQARPNASSLNYVAGQTVPNHVTVRIGAGGKVSLFNNSGSTHVIVDVVGWYD